MERISAMMDGELEADDAAQDVNRIKQDPTLRESWDTFHLIGDAMRGGQLLSAEFSSRFAQRLADEPTVLAPQRRPGRRIPAAVSYALSAAASFAAIAAVAWVALSGSTPGTVGEPQAIAQAPAAVEVAPPPASMPAIAEAGPTHDYLLAHQGVSPSTALQGVAPYVRTVTMSQQIDGR